MKGGSFKMVKYLVWRQSFFFLFLGSRQESVFITGINDLCARWTSRSSTQTAFTAHQLHLQMVGVVDAEFPPISTNNSSSCSNSNSSRWIVPCLQAALQPRLLRWPSWIRSTFAKITRANLTSEPHLTSTMAVMSDMGKLPLLLLATTSNWYTRRQKAIGVEKLYILTVDKKFF